MFKWFLFFSIVPFFCTCGSAVDLSYSTSEESGFLENMVDLRSGSIFIQSIDHIAAGRELLFFKKNYLDQNWDFHLPHLAIHNLEKNEIKLFDGEFKLLFSSPAIAEEAIEENHWWNTAKTKKKIKYQTDQQLQTLGQSYALKLIEATTVEGSEIGQKDYAGWVDGHKDKLEVVTPQGRQLFYKAIFKEKNENLAELLTDEIYYLLEKEILPNGNVLRYSYDGRYRLSALKALNPAETKTFSWLHFTYYNPYLIDSDFDIYTSDGMLLQYRLEKRKKKVFLKSLKSSSGLNESYSYFPEKNHNLLKTVFCRGKTYTFEYYPIKSGHDFKVKTVLLHKKNQLVPLYKLAYKPGSTEVIDIAGQKKVFFYDAQGRIGKIEYYTLQNKLSHSDKFIFSKEDKLIAKYRLDQNQKTFSALTFKYDKQGNLISEQLIGNLSGKNCSPLKFKPDGLPLLENVESHLKTWSYNSENQPVLEEEVFQKIEYGYANSQLCQKFISSPLKLEKRFFYTYDQDGLLIEEILDDGGAKDKENLQGVKERKIKRFVLKKEEPFYGCQESVEELCLNLDTQEEKLLSKKLLTYSQKGRVEKESFFGSDGKLAYTVKKSYDQFLNLSDIQGPKNNAKSFVYNENRELVQKKTKKGVTEYTYDENGLIIQKNFLGTDELTSFYKKTYDLKGLLIEEDYRLNKTKYVYDDFGHVIAKQLPSCLNEEGEEKDIVWQSRFDVWDREIASIDPLGKETLRFYNARDMVTKIIYPDKSEERFLYNLDGTLQSQIDQLGNKTVYTYDYQKRELKKEIFSPADILLLSQSKTYNSFHLIRETDALGRIKDYSFDFAGRLSKEAEGERAISYAYDALGYLCQKKIKNRENSSIYHFKNDFEGNLLEESVEDLQGTILSQKSYEKDWNFERVFSKDFEEKCFYDSLGRITRKENSLGKRVEYEYIEDYQNFLNQRVLQVIKKKNGKEVVKTYDALERLVQKEQKEPFDKEEFIYDQASFLRKKRRISFDGSEPLLEEYFYKYDSVGNLVQKRFLFPFFEGLVLFAYDLKGHEIKMTKPSFLVIEKSYDFLGYLKSLKSSDGAIQYAFRHNALGELLESQNLVVNNRADQIQDKNQKTLFVRNGFGEVIKEVSENGLAVEKEFDLLGRTQKLVLPDQSQLLFKWNPLHLEGTVRVENQRRLYEHRFFDFNAFGSWQRDSLLGGTDNLSYEFDLEGWKEKVKSLAFYQMMQAQDSQTGALAIVRNENGQVISKDTKEGMIYYAYDALDRLVEEKTAAHKIVYSYDALNRKMSRSRYLLNGNGQELLKSCELYLYEGDKEIGVWNRDDQLLKLKIEGDLIGQEFQVVAEGN